MFYLHPSSILTCTQDSHGGGQLGHFALGPTLTGGSKLQTT